MSSNQDVAISSFIVRYMLNHKRLSLDILKDKFNLDDLQIRKVLIRLYFRGQIFGKINKMGGKSFLIFLNQDNSTEITENTLTIEQIIDWDIKEFNLEEMKTTINLNDKIDTSNSETENDVYRQDMLIQSPLELDLSSSKEIHQKDLISIEMRFGISSYKICIRINVINSSEKPITQAKLKINFDNKSLRFDNIKPEYPVNNEESYFWIEIGDIEATQTKKFEIYFIQITRGEEVKVDGLMQYKSSEGYARVLLLYALSVDTSIPKIIPEKIPINMIKPFMRNIDMCKRIQGFGCPDLKNYEKIQNYLEEVTENFGFEQISKIEKENLQMSFYFGKTVSPKGVSSEVLVVPQLIGNVMAFYCCSQYEQIVVNLLRQMSFDLQELLRKKNVISDQNLINLNCVKCGNILVLFPPKGEFVACKSCQMLQKPW